MMASLITEHRLGPDLAATSRKGVSSDRFAFVRVGFPDTVRA